MTSYLRNDPAVCGTLATMQNQLAQDFKYAGRIRNASSEQELAQAEIATQYAEITSSLHDSLNDEERTNLQDMQGWLKEKFEKGHTDCHCSVIHVAAAKGYRVVSEVLAADAALNSPAL